MALIMAGGRTMSGKNIPKSRKLYFQISVTLLLFALMTAAILTVVYFSSVNSFLEAQDEYMRNVTNTAYRLFSPDDPDQYVLIQSFFEQNPSEIGAPLTKEEMRLYTEAVLSPDLLITKMI